MSTLETVLSRMMSDVTFAGEVFSDPDAALTEYDLSADELAQIKGMSREDFEKAASVSPEARKSFGWSNHNETTLKIRKGGGTNHNQIVLKAADRIKGIRK